MHAVPSWELVASHDAAFGTEPQPLSPLTEFTLTSLSPPRQTQLRNANPLCALASCTRAGMAVCNQGCGIAHAAAGAVHACPFGLEMRCIEHAGASSRWVGRRFNSARAMHNTLAMLELLGLCRDEIVSALPDEPVVALGPAAAQPSAGNADLPIGPCSQNSELPAPQFIPQDSPTDQRAGHILEYVEQVHRLIASPGKRDEICNRFLRALCGAVPYDEMAIYLADGDDLILAAAANRDDKIPHAHPTRPAPDGLAAQAAARSCAMVQTAEGDMLPLAGHVQPPAVAVPLLNKAARPIGVWLSRSAEPLACPIQTQPVRLMHLLADLLAERLEHDDRASAPGVEVVAIEDPNHKLMADLRAEVSRATRLESSLALLRVVAESSRKVRLPIEALGEGLVGALRPYDRVHPCPGESAAWWVIGAHTTADQARQMAARLVATLEDVMDAHGGVEELGVSFRVGFSVWGDDAANTDELVAHAAAAATDPLDPISQFRPPCLVMDDHG